MSGMNDPNDIEAVKGFFELLKQKGWSRDSILKEVDAMLQPEDQKEKTREVWWRRLSTFRLQVDVSLFYLPIAFIFAATRNRGTETHLVQCST